MSRICTEPAQCGVRANSSAVTARSGNLAGLTLEEADRIVCARMLAAVRSMLVLRGDLEMVARVDGKLDDRLISDTYKRFQYRGGVGDELWHHVSVAVACVQSVRPDRSVCGYLLEVGCRDPLVVLVASGLSALAACEALDLLAL